MSRVAVVGNLSLDRLDGGSERPGGGPFHAARALRLLRRPAVLLARCAAPDRSKLLPHLAALGVPVHWRDADTTARFRISYDGDARELTVERVGTPWPRELASWADGVLRDVRWVHVAPLFRSDFEPSWLEVLGRSRRLSLDGQGLVRLPREGTLSVDANYDPDLLRFVSILKLAEDEAQIVAGGVEERDLAALGVPEVVVTLGRRGSIVLADGLAEHVPVRPVEGEVDPTGAGDAFAAGYLVARRAGFAAPAAARWASGTVAALLSGRVE